MGRKPGGCSSVGRAPALQAGGQGFEPPQLHQVAPTPTPGHHLGPCGSGLHLRLTGACQTTPVDSTLMAPVGCAKHAHSTRGIKASQGTILASLKTEYVENSLSSRNCDQALLSNPGLELRGCRAINDFPSWQGTTVVFQLFAVGYATTFEQRLRSELEDEMRLRKRSS
jgi:hypothetical protein